MIVSDCDRARVCVREWLIQLITRECTFGRVALQLYERRFEIGTTDRKFANKHLIDGSLTDLLLNTAP